MTVLRIVPLFAFALLIAACFSSGGGPSSYSGADWRNRHDPPYYSRYPQYDDYSKKKSDSDGGWGKPVRRIQKELKRIFH